MPSWDEEESTYHRVSIKMRRWGDDGVPWTDVAKAFNSLHQKVWALGIGESGKDLADGALKVAGDDEHVWVYFEYETTGFGARLR